MSRVGGEVDCFAWPQLQPIVSGSWTGILTDLYCPDRHDFAVERSCPQIPKPQFNAC